jgi:GlcNAc-P-P-Und epimerase
MKILVTGGSGFIGTNLIKKLLEEDGIDIKNIDIKAPRNEAQHSNWVNCDICNFELLEQTFRKFQPKIVIHLAARTDLDGLSINDYPENVDGVANIIQCCNTTQSLERVIFVSSMLVCRLGYQPINDQDYCPTTAYGESKVKGEELVRSAIKSDIEWAIVRPTSLWGPWFDIPYRNFFDIVRSGYFMLPRDLKVYRSYGFILNSIDQLMCLIYTNKQSALCQTHYLADYEPIELSNWANEIIQISERGKIYRPPWMVLKTIAVIGDLLKFIGFKSSPMTSFRLNNMTTNAVYNTDSLQDVCGEQTYSMHDGVKITVNWLNRDK